MSQRHDDILKHGTTLIERSRKVVARSRELRERLGQQRAKSKQVAATRSEDWLASSPPLNKRQKFSGG
jgi:hypothetical protein